MRTRTSRTRALAVTAALLAAAVLGSAACGEKPHKKPVKVGYPVFAEYDSAAAASKAAGFKVAVPGYTGGRKLEHVTVLKVAPERKYADLVYTKGMSLTGIPRDGTRDFDIAMAEHRDYINKLPPRLQTYEEPTPVEIAGRKGILWRHKGGIYVENRKKTGVPSFHAPYLWWWDDALEYRLIVDDVSMYAKDPKRGVSELLKIASSVY